RPRCKFIFLYPPLPSAWELPWPILPGNSLYTDNTLQGCYSNTNNTFVPAQHRLEIHHQSMKGQGTHIDSPDRYRNSTDTHNNKGSCTDNILKNMDRKGTQGPSQSRNLNLRDDDDLHHDDNVHHRDNPRQVEAHLDHHHLED